MDRNWQSIIETKYCKVLAAAKQGEQRCLNGKRWGGSTVLIIVDAAIDSTGLNYFGVIVPRVMRFNEQYLKTGRITTLAKFAKLKPDNKSLMAIIKNARIWNVAINICKVLNRIKIENEFKSDFEALKYWAKGASYENWQNDEIGRVNGVGLITFQYLRMQAGIDTTMPDKIIKRVFEQDFGVKAENDIEFINKIGQVSEETGYSQIFLCWMVWLKGANVVDFEWELY